MTKRAALGSAALLALAAAPAFAADEGFGVWSSLEALISAAFSFGTTGLITFAVWRFTHKVLVELVGERVARAAAVLCCILVLSAGLRVADRFLSQSHLPFVKAVSNGILETFGAVVGPSAMSPLEFVTLLGLALFATYWLLTRFPAKTTWDQVREQLERLAERVKIVDEK